MNVVTANENRSIIDRLDIDIIKRIDGQFELRELLSKFVNLYFNKMIIDITSIANYTNIEVIKQLAQSVDPSRVILLLNNDPTVNSNVYMSQLVQLGFYNFTRNFEGVKFLYNTPNTLDNVRHILMDEREVKRQIDAQNAFNQQMQNASRYTPVSDANVLSTSEESGYEPRPGQRMISGTGRTIIGLVNLTNHAGATSLVNMMVRQLNDRGYAAVGLEMFRNDLIFYHDKNLSSCMNKNDLEQKLRLYKDVSAIIIDLNEFGDADKYCDEVLYLIEPSYIKLTKLLKKNRNAFNERKGDKIVLNMSFVNDQEIPDFEYETKLKVFDNLPPMNDRNKDLIEVNQLLSRLGFRMDV